MINNNSHNILRQEISNSNANNNNIFKDFENNSNILLSFSNISNVTKCKNDLSITRRNSYKDDSIIINKEKDLLFNIKNGKEKQSCIFDKMKVKTEDKNIITNNINNYKIKNDNRNGIIINNKFSINNEKDNKINSDKINTSDRVNIIHNKNEN